MTLRGLLGRVVATTPAPELILRYRSKRRLTVLGYHRVLPAPPKDYPFNEGVITATPEEFARELKYLKGNFDLISIPELLKGFENPSLLPERPAVITFDDGYVDNFTYAFPLLREAGVPACFFVCTALVGTKRIPWQEQWVCCLKQSRSKRIDSPFGNGDAPYGLDVASLPEARKRFRWNMLKLPWSQVSAVLERLRGLTGVDPSHFLQAPLFMTWDAAREMAAVGMDIGGHTRTHAPLSRVDDPALRDEVGGCFDDLRRELGNPPQAFAYPFGSPDVMSEAADEMIRQVGFGVCFSFVHGYSRRQGNGGGRVPRIHAAYGDDDRAFRLRLATAPDPH
jgi:peptidoglycan/xylan/chitin deacetylase (PgdA/CDA1 family)